MAKKAKKTKKRRAKVKPTQEQLDQRLHRAEIRSIFNKVGFTKVTGVSDREITFKGRTGDFDDVFVFQNIIVLTEYTLSKSENISTHLLKKKILFDHIIKDPDEFVEYLEDTFPTFAEARDDFYDYDQCKVVILYCSKNTVQSVHKQQLKSVIYFDYPIVKYFQSIADTIKASSRFEFFDFLNLRYDEIGKEVAKHTTGNQLVKGTILPESHSNFNKGYKVVSFYIDPKTLLEKSYVLRKDGWKDDAGLYQRMIIKSKIKAIRKYLYTKERVFINNIIVTLPGTTRLLKENGHTIDPEKLKSTAPVEIQIPNGFNVIGLIDGQHRVYAYHEGGEEDAKIEKLREKQNLLVTGIIYPQNISEKHKTEFEARLFLEINSNQANAKSELKQAISVILDPFASESIARRIIHKLNINGPLEGWFEEHFYEKDKVKTTSIVSYGLKPIVKLSGQDSFYAIWKNTEKAELLKRKNLELLNEYLDFCVTNLNMFLSSVKSQLKDTPKWTSDKRIKDKVLSTTAINGFIICLRMLIENKKQRKFEYYKNALGNIKNFDFSKYRSSQYNTLARDLYEKYFG